MLGSAALLTRFGLGEMRTTETTVLELRADSLTAVWGVEMGSSGPVIPASLVEADWERMEGTLGTFRPTMFPVGGRGRNLRLLTFLAISFSDI